MSRLLSFLRMPGAAGIVLFVLSVPLVLLLPGGLLIALAALCLYPLLDVPRILGRPSWWVGAMISALVWVVVFIALVQIAGSVRHADDDTLVFIYPFMLYPLALALSGAVRLEGRLRGRPPASGPRHAAIVVSVAYALLIIVPLTLGTIPVVMQKITGNSPANTLYSRNGEVLAATADRISVQMSGTAPESFRIGPETKFDFRGPGSPLVKEPAGPTWLKPGQRVGLEYIYRGGEAQATGVNIWIERKGCAGDGKWTAAGQTSARLPSAGPSLIGTIWEGFVGPPGGADREETTTFELLDQGRATYRKVGGPGHTDAEWRQDGASVLIEVNDCYALYEGRIEGDEIRGEFSNEMGARANWTARRKP